MSRRRIRLVAWHVFREGVRDRMLFAVVGFSVLLVAASFLLGQLTAGQDMKIIKDLGLGVIEASGVLLSVLTGVGLVAREIERRSIYALLARPMARWEFILGKYLGLVATLTGHVAVMTAALYAVLTWIAWTTPAAVRAGWEAPAADPALLAAVLMILAELAVLTAVALFFSTFSSSALWSSLFSLGIFIAGTFAADLRAFTAAGAAPARWVGQATAALLPAFSAFDVKAQVVHGLGVPAAYVAMTLASGALYVTALLVAAIAIFDRRDFQ